MTQNLKLFGLACHSLGKFADSYRDYHRALNKRRKKKLRMPTMEYIGSTQKPPSKADIYLVDSVTNLIAVHTQFAEGSSIVISDSPVLLSEFPGIISLDWDNEKSFSFHVRNINLSVFEKTRRNTKESKAKVIIPDSAVRLGLVLEQTVEGKLLTPLNKLMRQLSHIYRDNVRKTIKPYMAGQIDFPTFEKNLRSALEKTSNTMVEELLTELLAQLKQNGPLCIEAIQKLIAEKSFTALIKKGDISPFEVRYFTRLVKE